MADKFNLKDVKAINRLQNSEYTESDLVKITAAINNFTAKDLNKKTLYKPVNAFLGIGANIAHFSTNTIQSNAMLNNTSILPQVAGGVDVLLNPNTGQFAIRLEGLISANKYKADFDNATSPYYPLHYSFTQTSISVIPQIVYNVYNADKLKVYISPGAQICILSYGSKSFYSTNNGLNTSVDPIFTFDNYFITARIKAGLKINNRIDLSVSYQIPELITSTNYARIELSTIGTAFNYYF